VSGAARPARRAALRALAGAGALASTLAACGRAPGEGASGRATDPAPLIGPEAASPLAHAPAVALLPDMGDGATRGWVTGGSAPVAFILDPGADAQTGAPPIIFIGGDRKGWGAGAMTPLWRAQARGALAVGAGGAPRATLLTLGRPGPMRGTRRAGARGPRSTRSPMPSPSWGARSASGGRMCWGTPRAGISRSRWRRRRHACGFLAPRPRPSI